MGSDPGGHQNWPFDPGLSHYTPMRSELLSVPNLLFSPIWGVTDSLLLLPAQSGLMTFLHYPHLLDTYILHPGQGVWGITSYGGKSGAGLGSGGTHRSTLGPYTTNSGRFRPSGGPLTVLRWLPLRMGGCSPTVAPRGVYIRHLTPGRGTTGTWFKRWPLLSAFLSMNLT